MQRRIIILSVLVLSVGLIAKNIVSDFKSEVTKNDNQPPEEKEYKNKVIAALDNQNADDLKALFSKNARESIEDMDFKIALLLKRYKGKSKSVKYDRNFPVVTEDKEKGIKRIETYYVVKTDGGNIDFMYLQVVAKDDEDPDEIGISSMMYSPEIWQITMDDSNRGYYLWVDNPFWADYVDPDDVMTTETTCLSSVWETDEDTKKFLTVHGRAEDYKELKPADITYYDGVVHVDLSTIKPMIALPFHPSNVYEIDFLNANLKDLLHEVELEAIKIGGEAGKGLRLLDKIENGKLRVSQGIIAGCAGGTYSNVMEAAHILKGYSTGFDEFNLNVYPSSQPVFIETTRNGAVADLMESGAVVKTAFCGPCFGAGDTPSNNGLSIRHTTRNFPNRKFKYKYHTRTL